MPPATGWSPSLPGNSCRRPAREAIATSLARHPDPRWAGPGPLRRPIDLFAEAATWPDDIRNDPRFYDEGRPPPPLPGLPDTARAKRWHYIDLDAGGRVRDRNSIAGSTG
jgi:hypothetical protein